MELTDKLFVMNKWDICKGDAYFFANKTPILFKANLVDKEIKMIKKIPFIGKGSWTAYKVIGDNIFLFSDWGKDIIKYNLITQEKIVLTIKGEQTLGIFDLFVWESDIYAVSVRRGIIYVVDTLKFSIKKEILLYSPSDKTPIFSQSSISDGKIFVGTGKLCEVIIYDIRNDTLERLKLGDYCSSIYTLVVDNESMYLAGSLDGTVYQFEIENNGCKFVRKIDMYLNECQDENFPLFHRFVVANNKLILFNNFNDEISCVDIKKWSVKTFIPNDKRRSSRPKYLYQTRYTFLYIIDNKLIGIGDNYSRQIYEYNLFDEKIDRLLYQIDKSEKEYVVKEISLYEENRGYSLEDFLEDIII